MSRLSEAYRTLQRKRTFNPQYGREALLMAAMADAEGASRRLASGKRLELVEKGQEQQKEQFAEGLAFDKERASEMLAEQKRASLVREDQARLMREGQMESAERARKQGYFGMGLQAPLYGYATYKLFE
ncbi:hypothetical protein ES708_04637 [subsurface metagenome]